MIGIKEHNMKKMSKHIRNAKKRFEATTPIRWRKIGDALLGVSTFITGMAIYSDMKYVAEFALISGVIGKFITDLFTDDVVIIEEETTED